jgi:wobble nucleotide-excising tRNase
MKLEDKMKEMIEITKQMNCEETYHTIEDKNYKFIIKLINKQVKKEDRKIRNLKKELKKETGE